MLALLNLPQRSAKMHKSALVVGKSVAEAIPIAGPPIKAVLELISEIVKLVEAQRDNCQQLKSLSTMLQELGSVISGRQLDEAESWKIANEFETYLNQILLYVREVNDMQLMKQIYKGAKVATTIREFVVRIDQKCRSLHLQLSLSLTTCLADLEKNRKADKDNLDNTLRAMRQQQSAMYIMLQMKQDEILTAMKQFQLALIKNEDSVTRSLLGQNLAILQNGQPQDDPLQSYRISSKNISNEQLVSYTPSEPRVARPHNIISKRDFHMTNDANLGQGHFSVVYRGKWDQATVAIKMFHETVPMKAFQEEVRKWANLHHPHILELFGASHNEMPCFAVMPYCEDGTAIEYLAKHPEANQVLMAAQIAAGLQYLHRRNIVHGDLRASNVLIDPTASVKIIDFGMTKLKDDSASVSDGPTIAANYAWMSPERLSTGRVNIAADMYAYGITCWELFTLRLPWGDLDAAQVEANVRSNQRLKRPEHANLSDEFWNILTACWNKIALDRPKAAEVARRVTALAAEVARRVTALAAVVDEQAIVALHDHSISAAV